MTRKLLTAALGGFLGWMLLAQTPALAADSIIVKGSTTIGPVMRKMAGEFAKANKISVNVQGGGSGEGVKCAKDKSCNVGMASKAIEGKDAEGLKVTHFGWDGLAFVVNAQNAVKGLTKDQVAGIFNGKIKSWKEVGGDDKPIVAIARSKDSGENDFFKHVFGEEAKGTEEAGANDAILVKVAKDPAAISFMSFGIAQKNLSRGLKIVDFDGQPLTEDSFRTGKYPLRRELVLMTNAGAADPNVDKLVQHLLDTRKAFFEEFGFLPE